MVNWAEEVARQSREYSDAVNKRVAEKLAQKKRDLDAKAGSPKPEAGASPAFDIGGVTVFEKDGHTIVKQGDKVLVNVSTDDFSAGDATVTDQDGRTVIKQGDKVIVDVPSKNRDRSSRSDSSSHNSDGLAVPIVFIVFLFLFLIVKAIMGPIHQRRRADGSGVTAGPGLSAADSATLQKIHRTLGQMERRVEALETILADPRRTAAFTTVTRPPTTTPSTSYESKV